MGSPAAALLLLLAAPPARTPGRDLKAFYEMRCAVCHGSDGTGRGPGGIRLGARSFADPRALGKATDAELAKAIREGQGAMPAFGFLLDDAEAARLAREVVRPLADRKRR